MKLNLAISSLILLLCCLCIESQPVSENMNIPSTESFPLQIEREKFFGLSGNTDMIYDGSKVPFQVAVIRNDVQVYGSPMYQNKGALELWSSYYVYKYYKTKDEEPKEYYYLGIPDSDLKMDTRIGWVDKKYLVDCAEALRTPNKIYRRVIVFDNHKESRVPVYGAPVNGVEEMYKTPYFSFFYIYKETEDYYLIGVTPNIMIEDVSHDVLGWIHKKSCREWNTRLAVYYRPETRKQRQKTEEESQQGLVRVYDSIENALEMKQEKVLSQESSDSTWRYNMLPYPLLDSKNIEQKRMFQIAFLSGSNSDEAQMLLSKIKEEKDKLRQLDILLLVDASLPSSARAKITSGINHTIRRLTSISRERNIQNIDISWGISFYHDFLKNTNYPYTRGMLFQPYAVNLSNFNKDLSRLVRQISGSPYRGDQYAAKSLYYAIDMSLEHIKTWREGGTKCIVVIGNTGNHDSDSSFNVAKDLDSGIIKEVLEKNGARLYGLQFEETSAEKASLSNVQNFAKQIMEITKSMGEGGYFLISAHTGPSRPKTFTLENFFEILIDQYRQELTISQEAFNDLARGFLPEELQQRYQKNWNTFESTITRNIRLRSIPPQFSEAASTLFLFPEFSKIIQNFLNRYNLNFDELKGKGIFYSKGWVTEFNPITNISQMQIFLLVDKLELVRLLAFLTSLSQELQKGTDPNQYIQIWKTLLKSMFGIDTIPPNEPLDNLIMQHSGLPFMNGLLNYTLDDFVTCARNPTFRNEIITKLNDTCNRLISCLEEKETEEEFTPEGIAIQQTKRRWVKEFGSEILYAWLEVELFP